MSTKSVKTSSSRSLPRAAMAILWTIAIGGPALYLHNNSVKAAERSAEDQVLAQVAAKIKCYSVNRAEVMASLAKNQRELNDTRYVRVCNRLGIAMDWNSLFKEVGRRGKEERANAERVIAEECGMHSGMSLDREKLYLAATMMPMPMKRLLPLSMSSTSAD